MKDLCCVLLPSGTTSDDAVFRHLVEPALREADLEPFRMEMERSGEPLGKPGFERLVFCRFAVVDVTMADASLFYELGIREAIRPSSTVYLTAQPGPRTPNAEAPLVYRLDDLERTRIALRERLRRARAVSPRDPSTDNPLFQLVDGYPDIDRERTDVFRDRVVYSPEQKEKLAAARRSGAEALRRVERELGDFSAVECGTLIDLYLSYRAVRAWQEMIDLAGRLPRPLAVTLMVREQLALALNRAGRPEEAEEILLALIEERGPSSETCSLLGRVYKDCWENALKEDRPAQARRFLDQAIEAYLKGFEKDWRDTLPGINTVTLMELREPPDPRRKRLLPVVDYTNERRITAGNPDYWDYATRLELAVLRNDEETATAALKQALAVVREIWEPESTARNLRLIRAAREKRGEPVGWLREIEAELTDWTLA
ncbi:MAG TPA: TRAFs-binding domain-containing protein [Thermoanaerobaculia bacterium]|nr:TRAFs-binding domain-containing protein [Thermoanaerobaculia bacterium]